MKTRVHQERRADPEVEMATVTSIWVHPRRELVDQEAGKDTIKGSMIGILKGNLVEITGKARAQQQVTPGSMFLKKGKIKTDHLPVTMIAEETMTEAREAQPVVQTEII